MTHYVCVGDVRGHCGRFHRTMEAAQRCINADTRGCRNQGGYSDRRIIVINGDNYVTIRRKLNFV